jgi:hypothetical protein
MRNRINRPGPGQRAVAPTGPRHCGRASPVRILPAVHVAGRAST